MSTDLNIQKLNWKLNGYLVIYEVYGKKIYIS